MVESVSGDVRVVHIVHTLRHRVLANEDRVPLLDHAHYIHHKNGSMTITNVTDLDSGSYACRAWNAAGSDIVYIDVYNSRPGRSHSGSSITATFPFHVQLTQALPPSTTGLHLSCPPHKTTPPQCCTARHRPSPLPSSTGPIST